MRLHLSRHSTHSLIGFASKKMYTHSQPLPFNILLRSGSCRHMCVNVNSLRFERRLWSSNQKKFVSTWENGCFLERLVSIRARNRARAWGTYSNELVIDGKKTMPLSTCEGIISQLRLRFIALLANVLLIKKIILHTLRAIF